MKIGLFFGSFNPVHMGHLIIANTIVELSNLQQVWFVVSPQNPFKKQASLLHEFDRLAMVRLAIDDNVNLNVSDIEFKLSKPSYTVTTLAALTEKYPQHEFKIIMGSDNLKHIHKWRNYKKILEDYGVVVYPRFGSVLKQIELTIPLQKVEEVDAPMLEISATLIRKLVKEGKSIRYLVPDTVANHIQFKRFYI